jgi:hypothetical protein
LFAFSGDVGLVLGNTLSIALIPPAEPTNLVRKSHLAICILAVYGEGPPLIFWCNDPKTLE